MKKAVEPKRLEKKEKKRREIKEQRKTEKKEKQKERDTIRRQELGVDSDDQDEVKAADSIIKGEKQKGDKKKEKKPVDRSKFMD